MGQMHWKSFRIPQQRRALYVWLAACIFIVAGFSSSMSTQSECELRTPFGATERNSIVLPWIVSVSFAVHQDGATCGVGDNRTQTFLCFFGQAISIGSGKPTRPRTAIL
jgi:hypothetical protein